MRADRAAWFQAHRLAGINALGGTHLHTWGWAGLHALGAALGDAGLHTLGGALGWALSGTWLYADVDALRGADIHTLGAAGLHALGAAGRGALGGTRLYTLGGAGCGALGGTGCCADLYARCGAWLHTDAAAGLHAHRLAGLHTFGAFLHTNGRGQAGLFALLIARHPSELLVKLKTKIKREIQNQDTHLFFLSHNSQPELLKHI